MEKSSILTLLAVLFLSQMMNKEYGEFGIKATGESTVKQDKPGAVFSIHLGFGHRGSAMGLVSLAQRMGMRRA